MSAPTRGPWSVGDPYLPDGGGPQVWPVFASDTSYEATLCECWSGEHNNEANARLIAAAPQMLEALKFFFQAMDDGWLVRNTEGDGDPQWAMKSLPYVQGLQHAKAALAAAEPSDG